MKELSETLSALFNGQWYLVSEKNEESIFASIHKGEEIEINLDDVEDWEEVIG